MHKNIESILISEKELENIVNSLAKQIEKDYNGREFIMIGLLKGSMLFMSDLMKKIGLDFTIDFITASSYGGGTESSGSVKILGDVTSDVKDKDILIVEDVVDTGNTLSYVCDYLTKKGAKDVKVVTLCDKPCRRTVEFSPDYVGKVLPDKFIVGYGFDYEEKYRNLPYIGVLKSSVY